MAPRAYNLGRRTESVNRTRRRILDATVELYRERGVANTTIAEVAKAADVSRNTVVNHFGSAEGLLGAVGDLVIEIIDIPDERIFEGATTQAEKVRRFVDAVCRLYDRSQGWWQLFQGAYDDKPALKEREAAFWAGLYALGREAIGPVIDDRVVGLTVWTLLHPWPFGQLRWTGLTVEEAIAVLTDQVLHATRERKEANATTDS